MPREILVVCHNRADAVRSGKKLIDWCAGRLSLTTEHGWTLATVHAGPLGDIVFHFVPDGDCLAYAIGRTFSEVMSARQFERAIPRR